MKKLSILVILFTAMVFNSKVQAQNPYIGEIRLVSWATNANLNGWARCEGQLLSISAYSALFSLIGTTYGGNGTTNFALPDLRGRVPMSAGTQSSNTYTIGETGGSATNILTVAQLPAHNHSINAVSTDGNQNAPGGNLLANTKLLDKEYSDTPTGNAVMNSNMVSNTGNGQDVENRQPFLTMTYIIALQGIFPSFN